MKVILISRCVCERDRRMSERDECEKDECQSLLILGVPCMRERESAQ